MTEGNTALITINPEVDVAIIALYEQAVGLERNAESLIITDDKDIKDATNDLIIIGGVRKAIEERRKEYTKPIRDHLDAVNEAFKNFIAPLVNADSTYRGKIKEYDRQQEAIRVEQERINDLRIEAAKAEMELKGELTESVGLVDVAPEAPKHYRAETGMLGKVDHWRCDVIDFTLLPDEYKLPNQQMLNATARTYKDQRTIPGCRIWNDPSYRVTPTK